jgi:hypothetical protein
MKLGTNFAYKKPEIHKILSTAVFLTISYFKDVSCPQNFQIYLYRPAFSPIRLRKVVRPFSGTSQQLELQSRSPIATTTINFTRPTFTSHIKSRILKWPADYPRVSLLKLPNHNSTRSSLVSLTPLTQVLGIKRGIKWVAGSLSSVSPRR